MFHPTFLSQKVRIQLVRIHIIVCEAKAGTVEVLCKNNTPLLHCCWQCVFFEPRNEPKITFAPKILLCCHVISHMRRRYSALSLTKRIPSGNGKEKPGTESDAKDLEPEKSEEGTGNEGGQFLPSIK